MVNKIVCKICKLYRQSVGLSYIHIIQCLSIVTAILRISVEILYIFYNMMVYGVIGYYVMILYSYDDMSFMAQCMQ
jgi:hypothetical protein